MTTDRSFCFLGWTRWYWEFWCSVYRRNGPILRLRFFRLQHC